MPNSLLGVLTLVASAVTVLATATTLYLAVRRFGLQRETATFLRVGVGAKVIRSTGTAVLTAIIVRLDNLGQTRIDARTKPRDAAGLLYDDGWDRFQHAGTLKIRSIADEQEPVLFDWYSLPILQIVTLDATSPGEVVRRVGDLEQINYLEDYQDPDSNFAEAHFWLEPKESYELVIPLWLPAGAYAAKAVFLGAEVSHANQEYWSHVCPFSVGQGAAASSS